MELSAADQITVKETYAALKAFEKSVGLKLALVSFEHGIKIQTELSLKAGRLVLPTMEAQIKAAICEQMLTDYEAFLAETPIQIGWNTNHVWPS